MLYANAFRRWAAGAGRVPALLFLACLLAAPAAAQNLRYDNRREVRVPDDATLRLGPFYSTWVVSLTAGYRYVNTTGSGEDFLFGSSRGALKEDGSDIPLILAFVTRNYLIITPRMDLDVSLGAAYEYYPLGTQDDQFRLFLPDEGLNASLSLGFEPRPYLRGEVYDRFSWRTDYLDTRGMEDRYGGQEFEVFENTVGVELDLLVASSQMLGFGVSRHDRLPLEDGWEEQERVVHAGHLLYEWKPVDYAVVGARAGVSNTDYPATNRSAVLLQEYTLYTEIQATDRSRVRAFAGYALADLSADDDREVPDVSTVVYGGALETELRRDLSHSLSGAHGLRTGYNTAAETFDELQYRIRWSGERTGVEAFTAYRITDPSRSTLNSYTDWTSGVALSRELRPYLTLSASTRYAVRDNEETANTDLDPEYRADYETWASRLGLTTRLADELSLLTYVEHVERYSDDPDLEYTRDVLAALLTYRHEI